VAFEPSSPLGLRCCRLGTLGIFEVQSFCAVTLVLSLATLLLDKRDSVPGRFVSVLGAPTCLTEAAGMVGEPLFGGTGGLDEECRR
jgi:hypothetical protein